MKKNTVKTTLLLALTLTLLVGWVGGPGPISDTTAPLSADNLNLIFVVSPDLAYHAPGDINPDTANLSNQGLQRSLLMATYLKKQVLGTKNVNRIYALEPMTHLQTANNLPDIAALGYIQQFAMLNQISLLGEGGYGSPLTTGNSYPINVSYATGVALPAGVIAPDPLSPCRTCQGLDFNDTGGANEALVNFIIKINYPGFYVFSAPWETTSALMANINKKMGYNLSLPAAFVGPNLIYAISLTPSGSASLVTYDSNLNPPSTYPVLPEAVASAPCTAQKPFNYVVTDGVNGAKIPEGANTNETFHMIRHAEAHPAVGWDDGNYVAAGQWRALALANTLRGKINPSEVYSIDPAQVTPNNVFIAGPINFSYVRTVLTIEPYAIANNLPYYLVSDINLIAPDSPKQTSDKFFRGGAYSNKTILLSWEHDHYPPIVAALLASYFPGGNSPKGPAWPGRDYDTIWTVKLDAHGNLTVNNELCEGIDSTKLPATAPEF